MENLKKETIKKLEEVKNNLAGQTNEQNYCDMVNTMIDYDNEAQDNIYLYDSMMEHYEFIDTELLEGYITSQLKDYGVERLRYILNDTYNDNIYYLNAYGNLENVNDDIFKDCINEAIEQLEEAIKEESEVE